MPASSPYLLLILGSLALLVVDLLIALVEGVFLTWLSFLPFRQSMSISFIMNIISGIVNGILLVILQRSPYIWLPISFVLAVIIESFVMTYFKRHDLSRNGLRAIFVNLASYVILILPAYYFGSRA
ncbi:MAG TPA: hypothetical protein VF831_06705 [Anaerolineales bacterium]